MQPNTTHEIPKFFLQVLNNVNDIERKVSIHGDLGNIKRNVDRIKTALEDAGLIMEDPMGQPFNETRTDLEATITGVDAENLEVVEVIKPIIRAGNREYSRVVQKGIVIVQSVSKGDK